LRQNACDDHHLASAAHIKQQQSLALSQFFYSNLQRRMKNYGLARC
jgi:hypothetical protein